MDAALVENASSPVTGLFFGSAMPEYFSTFRERAKRCERSYRSMPPLVRRMTSTSSSEAFPERSPMPFTVVWSWNAPACAAVIVFATAHPISLWQCAQNGLSTEETRSVIIVCISPGIRHPTVSAKLSRTAPWSAARRYTSLRKQDRSATHLLQQTVRRPHDPGHNRS